MDVEELNDANQANIRQPTTPQTRWNRLKNRIIVTHLIAFTLGAVFGSIVLLYAFGALFEAMHGPKWSGTTRLVEELNSGVVKQGDELPSYADTHDFPFFSDADDTSYGTNTFEERGRGINLTIFWYRPPSTHARIIHSAFLANGAKDYWSDRWFFYDPDRMTIHVRLAEEFAREQNAETKHNVNAG